VDPRRARRRLLLAHEREVRDRQEPLADVGPPVAVAERIELLDVAELEPRAMAHPAAQSALEREVALGVERTRGNRRSARRLQRGGRSRPRVADGSDHGFVAERGHLRRPRGLRWTILEHRRAFDLAGGHYRRFPAICPSVRGLRPTQVAGWATVRFCPPL